MIDPALLDRLREADPAHGLLFKTCNKCHVVKPVSEFGVIKRDNCLKSWCKECCNAHGMKKRRERGILPQKGCKRSEEFKRKASEANYKKWSNPEYRKRCSETHKRRYLDPLERAKTAEQTRNAFTEEVCAKISRARKIALNDPKERERLRIAGAKRWKDPEEHRKQSEWSRQQHGENHPSWKGGVSFEPYCPKFNPEFKRRVRAFFGNKCVICGKTKSENGKNMHVHHVDYDKQVCCNDKQPRFVTLCGSHHSMTNTNRTMWQYIFNTIIDNVYDGKSYYTLNEYIQFECVGETNEKKS